MAGSGQADCPDLETLEAYCREETPGPVADHVRRCPRCRGLVGDVRRNAVMLERLASLAAQDADGVRQPGAEAT